MSRYSSMFACMLVVLLSIAILQSMVLPSRAQQPTESLDQELRRMLAQHQITPLDLGPAPDEAKVILGQMLFFDPILSGNRDTSCATCHHPSFATSDALPLSIGTGATGLGMQRLQSDRIDMTPRHAPDLFNRGAPEWRTMFWDSRVVHNDDGSFTTPAGEHLPPGLDNVLAAQALFPMMVPEEMRGFPGDHDIFGNPNDLAILDADDHAAIWEAIMKRVLAIPDYQALFATAYPDISASDLHIGHAANAIAAFEASAFTFADTPWDRYVAGDDAALSDAAKRGAIQFFGVASCANCHTGNLLTNQEHHNIAIPQLGPGTGDDTPLDIGRAAETGRIGDRFAFRTPPLRNVALTAPYMHNGAYATLAASVRHYIDPEMALHTYDPAEHLPPPLHHTVRNDPALLDDILLTLDPLTMPVSDLSDQDVADLVTFLVSLTDPAAMELDALIPSHVPSGLTVERLTRWDGNIVQSVELLRTRLATQE